MVTSWEYGPVPLSATVTSLCCVSVIPKYSGFWPVLDKRQFGVGRGVGASGFWCSGVCKTGLRERFEGFGVFRFQSESHEICDRDHEQVMLPAEDDQIRHAGHSAIVVDDLADHTRGVQSG